jgi:hypothetical protein
MSLRRFENFKVGALDAKRLNEMVDAIIDLQRRVDRVPKFDYSQYGPFLARVTQLVDVSQPNCGVSGDEQYYQLQCATYYFEEVVLRIDGTGGQASSIDLCAKARHVPGSLRSSNAPGAEDDVGLVPLLVDLGVRSFDYEVGDIVPCFRVRVDIGSGGSDGSKWRYLYVIMGSKSSEARYMRITQVIGNFDRYMARGISAPDSEQDVEIYNQYEDAFYHGALDPPQNPCATLVPKRLRVGDPVIVHRVNGVWRTVGVTAFSVACQPCGTNPGGTLASTYDAAGNEASVVGMMLKGT